MPQAPDPSFGLGWRSGDQADAQEASARQQQSYLEQVLANARTKSQEDAERQAKAAEFIGSPDDGPDMLAFADRIDPVTNRPVYKSLAGYQAAQAAATTKRERAGKIAAGKSIGHAARARYAPGGDLAGQPIPAEVLRRITSLESGHLSPTWDKDLEEMRQFGDPNWNKSPAERKLIEAKRTSELAQAEDDTRKYKHPEIGATALPFVSQYLHTYGDGVTMGTLDMNNPDHRQLKIDAMEWARDQMQKNDPARAKLAEEIRRNRVTEAQKDRELGYKDRELRLKERESEGGLGKPMGSEAAKSIVGVVRLSDATAEIDRIKNDPAARKIVDGYIGPYAHRYATAQTYAGGSLGKVPTEVVDLEQRMASIKNYTIKLITGAQMGEKEAERIMKELPDVSLPPDQFWRRYENSKKDIARMRQIVDLAIIQGDRRALAVMEELEGKGYVPQSAAGPSSKPSSGWGPVQRIK